MGQRRAARVNRRRWVSLLTITVFGLAVPACDGSTAHGGPAQPYPSACPEKNVLDANPSVSGIPNVNGFFATVNRIEATGSDLVVSVEDDLDAIAASVGARAGDAPDIQGKLQEQLDANVLWLTITYPLPQCAQSATNTVKTQADCDPSISILSTVMCEGSCSVSPSQAGPKVNCGDGAVLSCTGVAPMLACSGTCRGDCEFETPAPCAGTCRGTCDGLCTVVDAGGACAGTCTGNCRGTCELTAPASCSGLCAGECTYTPADGTCDAASSAHCDTPAGVQAECSEICLGKLTPPSGDPVCAVTAEADASLNADCAPPPLTVQYQLTPEVAADAMKIALFRAWLEGFESHVASILAHRQKMDRLGAVCGDILDHGMDAVAAVIKGALKAKPDQDARARLQCASDELDVFASSVLAVIGDAATRVDIDVKEALHSVGVK